MNCYVCADASSVTTPAVATCTSCGVAVCREHAVERAVQLSATVGMGRVMPIATPSRVIRCALCDAAELDRARTVR